MEHCAQVTVYDELEVRVVRFYLSISWKSTPWFAEFSYGLFNRTFFKCIELIYRAKPKKNPYKVGNSHALNDKNLFGPALVQ